jgi:hypothetical protein
MEERRLSFKERNGYEPIDKPLIDVDERIFFQVNKILEKTVLSTYSHFSDNLSNIYTSFYHEDLISNFQTRNFNEWFLNSVKYKIGKYSKDNFIEYLNFWDYFFFEYCKTIGVYDDDEMIDSINGHFKRFNSKWRLIDFQFVKIVNDEEIASIKQTLNHEYDPLRKHSREALGLMKGENASYPNSMKESLCMMEAALQTIVGNNKLTPGLLIKELKANENSKVRLNELESIIKLYGVCSEEGGQRHAIKENDNVKYTYEDALYLYVRCSAFVNWILATYPKVA